MNNRPWVNVEADMRYFAALLLVACTPVRQQMYVDAGPIGGDAGPNAPDAHIEGDAGPGAPDANVDAYVDPGTDAGGVVYSDAGIPMLDQFEVGGATNLWPQYVAAGMPEAHRADGTSFGPTTQLDTLAGCIWSGDHFRNSGPYNCVTWATAMGFCQWQGLRLPTHDEWLAEASMYPPGNETVNASGPVSSLSTCTEHLCDTRGNVAEWVMDVDPSGIGHLAVGAAYDDLAPSLTTVRVSGGSDPHIGFRCRRL